MCQASGLMPSMAPRSQAEASRGFPESCGTNPPHPNHAVIARCLTTFALYFYETICPKSSRRERALVAAGRLFVSCNVNQAGVNRCAVDPGVKVPGIAYIAKSVMVAPRGALRGGIYEKAS